MRRALFPIVAAMTAYACGPRSEAPTTPREPQPTEPIATAVPADVIAPTGRVDAEPSALPMGLTSFGAAKHGAHVYVLGGWMGEPHRYDAEHQSDGFLHVDPDGKTPWASLASIGKVQSPSLVAVADGLVTTGGLVAHNQTGAEAELESLDRVAHYDPKAAKWRTLAPLPEPRSSHDAAIVDGEMWVVGGWRIARDGKSEWHKTALHRPADEPHAKWISVDVPIVRRAHAVVGLPGKLVVVGGMGTTGPTSRVDVLDVRSNEWSRAPELPGPGFGVAAVAHEGAVLASGSDGIVWSWTPGAKDWTALGRLAFPRFFHRMVVDDGALLVVGGISGAGTGQKIRATERFAIGGPELHVVQIGLDAPGTAKNRQGLMLHKDRLLVVGGNNGLEQHDFAPERFVDEVWSLELGALRWEARAPLPVKRQSLLAIATAFDGGLVLGGFGHDGEVARTWSDGYQYDFAKDTWTSLGEAVPGTRSQAGIVEYDRKLFLFGGLDYDPRRPKADQFRHPRTVLTSALPKVVLEPGGYELPHQRRAFGGALLGDELFMVGGLAEGFANVAPCEAIAVATGKARTIACPARPRLSPELVAIDGRLLLAGGMVDSKPEPSIELYDPATDTWRTLDVAMPLPIPHLRMLAWGDRVLAFSAHDAEAKVHLAVLSLPPRAGKGKPASSPAKSKKKGPH